MRATALIALMAAGCFGEIRPLNGAETQQPSPSAPAAPMVDAAQPPAHTDGGAPPADLARAIADAAPAASDLTTCIPLQTTVDDGHHNPGKDCLTCHDGNHANATKFLVAGTLFSAATGGTGVAGATVEIVDSAGIVTPLVTAMNGNFYTSQAVTFPLTVRATSCPNEQPMITKVLTTGASCNNCHATGKLPQQQIHLP